MLHLANLSLPPIYDIHRTDEKHNGNNWKNMPARFIAYSEKMTKEKFDWNVHPPALAG
jgi:hypothetical protein